MPNVQAKTFFWSAEMVVARWNLAGCECGPRDEKVADPCDTQTLYKRSKWYACKKNFGNQCPRIFVMTYLQQTLLCTID